MYANFDPTWAAKQHKAKGLLGYKFDGEEQFTENTTGFSVPVNTKMGGDDTRITFDITMWIKYALAEAKEDGTESATAWIGKTSCYFTDYINLSEQPLYPVVAPAIIEGMMR